MAPQASTSNGTAPATIPLTNSLMVSNVFPPILMPDTNCTQGKLKPAKIFKNALEPQPSSTPGNYTQRSTNSGPRHITGISFDDRGDQVITAGEDETFRLYNCKTGKRVLVLAAGSFFF